MSLTCSEYRTLFDGGNFRRLCYMSTQFRQGIEEILYRPEIIKLIIVVDRKEKDQGHISYDLDDDTEYSRPPQQGKGPRVLLD